MTSKLLKGSGTSKTRLVGGFTSSISVTMLGIIQQIFLVPLFVRNWPPELYASWLILFSLSVLIAAADLGLHVLAINRYQEALNLEAQAVIVAFNRNLRDFVNSYFINAVLLTVTAALFAALTEPAYVLHLSGAPTWELRLSFLFMVLTGIITMLTSGCSAIYRAHLKVARIMWLKAITLVLQIAIQTGILLSGGSILAMAAALFGIGLLVLLYMVFVDIPKFAKIEKNRWHELSWSRHFATLKSAAPFIVPTVADSILTQGPLFIMGVVNCAPATIVTFNICRIMASVPRMLTQQVSGLLGPEIGDRNARSDLDGMRANIRLGLTLSSVFIGVSIGALAGLGEPLFKVWTGGAAQFDGLTLVLLMAALAVSAHTFQVVAALLYCNQPAIVAKIQIYRVVASSILVAILASQYGALGAAAALVLTDITFSSLPFALALLERFPVSGREFWRWSTRPLLLWFAGFSSLSLLLRHALNLNSKPALVLAVTVVGTCAVMASVTELRANPVE